jgi:hypothetical protein
MNYEVSVSVLIDDWKLFHQNCHPELQDATTVGCPRQETALISDTPTFYNSRNIPSAVCDHIQ